MNNRRGRFYYKAELSGLRAGWGGSLEGNSDLGWQSGITLSLAFLQSWRGYRRLLTSNSGESSAKLQLLLPLFFLFALSGAWMHFKPVNTRSVLFCCLWRSQLRITLQKEVAECGSKVRAVKVCGEGEEKEDKSLVGVE